MTREEQIKYLRDDLKDLAKSKVKSSWKKYQEQAKIMLTLSDDDLEKWIEENKTNSFTAFTYLREIVKQDKAKYNRLKRKAEEWDFEEFTEDEELFILSYEEENNITESIL